MLYITVTQALEDGFYLTDTNGIQCSGIMPLAQAIAQANTNRTALIAIYSTPQLKAKCKVIFIFE